MKKNQNDYNASIASSMQMLPAQIGNVTIWDLQLSLPLVNALSDKNITTLKQILDIPVENIVTICAIN